MKTFHVQPPPLLSPRDKTSKILKTSYVASYQLLVRDCKLNYDLVLLQLVMNVIIFTIYIPKGGLLEITSTFILYNIMQLTLLTVLVVVAVTTSYQYIQDPGSGLEMIEGIIIYNLNINNFWHAKRSCLRRPPFLGVIHD